LEDQILSLKQVLKKIPDSENLDVLRGYEGHSAVLYFGGLAQGIIGEKFQFHKRVRRPPTDPVNALLSLGYSLLFNTVMAAVSMVGFDPYLGCLHAVDYGRPSLALDLMEEWRPIIVDLLVLSVLNLKILAPDDFILGKIASEDLEDDTTLDPLEETEREPLQDEPGKNALPVQLTDSGFKKFITQFERKMAEKINYPLTDQQFSYRDSIREQVRHFARYVRGEEEQYQPIQLK
jgi:CRISPR-associated protein Cas1